jgi:hypothetical protein
MLNLAAGRQNRVLLFLDVTRPLVGVAFPVAHSTFGFPVERHSDGHRVKL